MFSGLLCGTCQRFSASIRMDGKCMISLLYFRNLSLSEVVQTWLMSICFLHTYIGILLP